MQKGDAGDFERNPTKPELLLSHVLMSETDMRLSLPKFEPTTASGGTVTHGVRTTYQPVALGQLSSSAFDRFETSEIRLNELPVTSRL
jgi:hypothetical protein